MFRIIGLLLGMALCFGQEQKIDSYLRANDFRGSVLIAKGGKVLFSKGYGYANVEHQIPNTPKTVFRVGSITKQFTAVAILKLQEQGKLDVRDPISKYIPGYPQGEKITIHHLLSHSAGIPSITDFSNLSEIQRHPSTVTHVMSYFKNLSLEFPPGSDYKYSDSGYIVLGAIVEAVTGAPYEKYVQDHFFIPLGMKSTYMDRNQSVIPNRASGYNVDSKGTLVNAEFIEMSFPHGAGAMASTVEDLYLWDRALKEGKLLSKESSKQLFKVQASNKKNEIAYGYGFFIDQAKKTIGHKGGIEGFRAGLYRHLENDLTVILLSNKENTDVVALDQELSSYWRP